jgi:ribosome biogenesis protein Tsr3
VKGNMLSILDKIKLWRKFLELNRDPLVRYLKAKDGTGIIRI